MAKTTKTTKASPKKAGKKSVADQKATILTAEGLQKLKDELHELENVKRKEVADKIKEAVSYGDLSENSEYVEAKNEQAFVEGRILQLTEQIKYAKIIDEASAHNQSKKELKVQLGNNVNVEVLNGKLEGEKYNFVIVGTTEVDPMNQRISNESPVGAALLDKKVGDVIDVDVPVGTISYKVLSIS